MQYARWYKKGFDGQLDLREQREVGSKRINSSEATPAGAENIRTTHVPTGLTNGRGWLATVIPLQCSR
jgi:hypothetical protein